MQGNMVNYYRQGQIKDFCVGAYFDERGLF